MDTKEPLLSRRSNPAPSAPSWESNAIGLRSEDIKISSTHHAVYITADCTSDTCYNGLSSLEAQVRLQEFGLNEIVEKSTHPILKFLKFFWGGIPFMIEIAILISAIVEDWLDFGCLLTLLIVNGVIGFKEEYNAGNAVAALKASLAPKCRVRRDGEWVENESKYLVPGDLIMLKIGDIVPADCTLCSGVDSIDVDQSALTGESLPVTKWPGEPILSGSTIKRGDTTATIDHTGARTFFGKAATLADGVVSQGNFQKVLMKVARVLILAALFFVSIIFGVELYRNGDSSKSIGQSLKLCLLIMVASIPVAMQVVCTATMAVGARSLAEDNAIVCRLSAIEELAGMQILCSDKTGTLTKNVLTLDTPYLMEGVDEAEFVGLAALCCNPERQGQDAIDTAISAAGDNIGGFIDLYKNLHFVPFDPVSKRTESTVEGPDGNQFFVTKGAPQVVLAMSWNASLIAEEVQSVVEDFATRGLRSLGLARTRHSNPGRWEFLGILPIFDPPRDDTLVTIQRTIEMGVSVRMVTGDQVAIAKETCRRLNMGTNILTAEVLTPAGEIVSPSIHHGSHSPSRATRESLETGRRGGSAAVRRSTTDRISHGSLRVSFVPQVGASSRVLSIEEMVEEADGFAQVMPEHKFEIVDILQKRGFTVGMTGDGVNDVPALKRAHIGIAVEGATPAARAAADIVLVSPGLSVITKAIERSRMIFQRMKNYCTYRIACTIQILIFFFVAILAMPDEATIPSFIVVLIMLINDGTIMSIAYDNVIPSKYPNVWDIPVIIGVACSIGLVGVAASLILLYSCAYTQFWTQFGLPDMSHQDLNYSSNMSNRIHALIYLQLSLGGQLTVFVARTRGLFFSRRPGWGLAFAFVVSQIASTCLTLWWPWSDQSMLGLAVDTGPGWNTKQGTYMVFFIWAYCIFWFFVQDIAKLIAYRVFDPIDESSVTNPELARLEKQRLARQAGVLHDKTVFPPMLQGIPETEGVVFPAENLQKFVSVLSSRVDVLESEVSTLRIELKSLKNKTV